jgi:hypothetical protein
MNKKSTIKTFDDDRTFTVISTETKDASGIFAFYSLLMEPLAHFGRIGGITGIPDVSTVQVTYWATGQREISGKFVEIAQMLGATARVGVFFAQNLIPPIWTTPMHM